MTDSEPSTADATRVANYRKQRAITKGNVSRIKKYIEDLTTTPTIIQLECRLEILCSYIKELMAYQREIEKIDASDDRREELEELCINTKSLLLSKIKSEPKETSFLHDATMTPFAGHVSSRLPSVKIPKFNGDYTEYKNFMSCFKRVVHNESSLDNIEKFNYLISHLTDEALRTVKAFQITDENYEKALGRLAERYDNDVLIFNNLISSLFDLQKIVKPSASALREVSDKVSAVLDSLSNIGTDKEVAHALVIHLVLSKVDPATKLKWEEQLDYKTLPSWVDCAKLLNRRSQFLDVSEQDSSKNSNSKTNAKPKQRHSSAFISSKSGSSHCIYCSSKNHTVQNCEGFLLLDESKRFTFIKQLGHCINCFNKGHSVSKCKAVRCTICKRPHNTLLHFSRNESLPTTSSSVSGRQAEPNSAQRASFETQVERVHSMHAYEEQGQTLLATAVIRIKDKFGVYQFARALLDSGSQSNFITENLAQQLLLKRSDKALNIIGIGSSNSKVKQKVSASISSRITNYELFTDLYILKTITGTHPEETFSQYSFDIPANLPLADPLFFESRGIDLLLGVEAFFDIMCIGQIKLGNNLPILQKTLFGWIVSGKLNTVGRNSQQLSLVVSKLKDEENIPINKILQRFWEIEEVSCEKVLSPEHQLCETHFKEHTYRLPCGRFEVRLPFKMDPTVLGSSYDIAVRRYLCLERRLSKDPLVQEMYTEFMREYVELGHMSPVTKDILKGPHYCIPHQCVLRPESSSTKLRVVFDASSKTSTQISLNDTLMVGPTIQPDVFSTLLRFRLNKYALCADITKMYRQVRVREEDRRFQLVLWRESKDQDLQIYQLNTVTYGTSSAPFQAIRCLKELGNKYATSHPKGAEVLSNHFYVDDLVSGANSLEELCEIKKEVAHILDSAGFKLAKWQSNHQSLWDNSVGLNLNQSEFTTALGIRWNSRNDIFSYKVNSALSIQATKRTILSVASRVFDPLGLIGPIIIKAKIILQDLWLNKLDWDESVPVSLATKWIEFTDDLVHVETISIPRFVQTSKEHNYEIHGFADASLRAYGCCIYVRTQVGNNIITRLLVAKSKVAPIKTQSLPRLELCAALLLAKLWCSVQPVLHRDPENIYFWSDSEIILYWLQRHPSTLSTFVSNRVSKIQEVCNSIEWKHVPTRDNPADIISRGCNVQELKESIWFTGPLFLSKSAQWWPKNNKFTLTEDDKRKEVRKSQSSLVAADCINSNFIHDLCQRFSSSNKIIRVVGYIIRFYLKTKQKVPQFSMALLPYELDLALLKVVQVVQTAEFKNEINLIKNEGTLKPHIQKLSPFLQEYATEGLHISVLRVGGRLLNAPLNNDAKFPLLMTKDSLFIKRYISHLHITSCHAGPKILLALLRQRFWLVNARDLIRKVVRSCVLCFKFKPKLQSQIMGDLPKDRFQTVRPFYICGVDFCGPIYLTHRIRGRPPYKCYVAVFVCFSTKAVHLEALSDMMSETFLSCLHRFTGRRGVPKRIWSDNAKTFKGVVNILKGTQEQLQQIATDEGIELCFIPPRAPHFGGLWEAAVKSAKTLMMKKMSNAKLTYEELSTLLIDVEAILNSRPITPLSEDPTDGEALTPGHLLIGTSIKSLPLTESNDTNLAYFKRYRAISSIKSQFWQTWLRDYVLEQQSKEKWFTKSDNLKVGMMVMIHDDNLPPQKWLLGRIVDVTPGQDGNVRVANVRTKNGLLKRPIHKLAPIPVSST